MKRLQGDTRILLLIASVLTVIGFVFVYSSSSVYALERLGSPHYFLLRQLAFFGVSLVGFFVFAATPLKIIKRAAPFTFLLALGGTILTHIPNLGVKMHGANRWIRIAGMSLQPSEVLKLFLFLYLAFLFTRKQKHLTSLFHTYIPFLLVLGVSCVALLKQPDFGSTVTVFTTSLILFFIAEFSLLHLGVTLLCAIPLAITAILFKSYRLNRILIFLNPWVDAQGRGYQIIQSLIAIGSGHWWGLGIGGSKQKFFYLPMQHTDFIFSIIAEEVGLVGSTLIVLLYVAFCYYGLRIATQLRDPFSFFVTLAYTLLITLQAVINLMVVTGMVPTKGLGLPFISYGGSALMVSWCMLGVIANCVRAQR